MINSPKTSKLPHMMFLLLQTTIGTIRSSGVRGVGVETGRPTPADSAHSAPPIALQAHVDRISAVCWTG
jgi:hypothetical protein